MVTFWFSLADWYSTQVLGSLMSYLPNLNSAVTFAFSFKIYDKDYLRLGKNQTARYCYGKGDYCAPLNSTISHLDEPRKIILEGIKVNCLINEIGSNRAIAAATAEYIDYFEKNCLQRDDIGNCTKGLIETFYQNIHADRVESFRKCISIADEIQEKPDDKHLELDNFKLTSFQFGNYDVVPSMFINADLVKGSLSAKLAVSAICDSLLSPPDICGDIENSINEETSNKLSLPGETRVDEDTVPIAIYYYLAFSVTLIFGLIVLLLGRLYLKHTLKLDSQQGIDLAVSGYRKVDFQVGQTRKLTPLGTIPSSKLDTTVDDSTV